MSARTGGGSWGRVQAGQVWPAGGHTGPYEPPIASPMSPPHLSGVPAAHAAAARHRTRPRHQGRTAIQAP
jgi:hypothetical protein